MTDSAIVRDYGISSLRPPAACVPSRRLANASDEPFGTVQASSGNDDTVGADDDCGMALSTA
jgi:hypothetical protein